MLDKLGITGSSPVPPTLIKALRRQGFSRFVATTAQAALGTRGKEMATGTPIRGMPQVIFYTPSGLNGG
jgi:hypothetical protein